MPPNGSGGREGDAQQLSDFIPAPRRQGMGTWNLSSRDLGTCEQNPRIKKGTGAPF